MTVALTDEFDPELPVIKAARGGDRHAFEELLRRQGRWVRGVIFGILGDQDRVDDVSQQVWTAVWQRIADLQDASRWRPWLYRLARNAAIDAGRDITRRRKQAKILLEIAPVRSDSGHQSTAVDAELHGEVLKAIQALPTLYREPFVLRHLNGWSYRQIGDVMDMPVDTVETRLVRARRMLREALKDKIG